jgi:hypothetical protein
MVGTTDGSGGGAFARSVNVSLSPGNSYTVHIGAGGTPGQPAAAGGDTWIVSTGTLLAKGSPGALGGTNLLANSGGQASSCVFTGPGSFAFSGGSSSAANILSASGGGAAGPHGNGAAGTVDGPGGNADAGFGGAGGALGSAGNNGTEYGTAGAGGGAGSTNAVGSGHDGGLYGGGASGGYAGSSSGMFQGGNGAPGVVVITYVPAPKVPYTFVPIIGPVTAMFRKSVLSGPREQRRRKYRGSVQARSSSRSGSKTELLIPSVPVYEAARGPLHVRVGGRSHDPPSPDNPRRDRRAMDPRIRSVWLEDRRVRIRHRPQRCQDRRVRLSDRIPA